MEYGMIILLLCVALATIVSERTMRLLSTQRKGELLELFANRRYFSIGIIAVLALVFLVENYFHFEYIVTIINVLNFGCVLFLISSSFVYHNKLKKHDFPPAVIQGFVFSNMLRTLGLSVFLVSLYLNH